MPVKKRKADRILHSITVTEQHSSCADNSSISRYPLIIPTHHVLQAEATATVMVMAMVVSLMWVSCLVISSVRVDVNSAKSAAEGHRGKAGAGSAPTGPGSAGGGGTDGVPASARW